MDNIDSNDLYFILMTIFSAADFGIALVDKNGDILKSNKLINNLLSSSPKLSKSNLNDYIYDLSFSPDFLTFKTYTNKSIVIKSKAISINGEIKYYLVVAKDTTSESNLLKMYENIIQNLDYGIECIDSNGQVVIYNNSQGVLDDYNPSEILNKKVLSIYDLDKDTCLLKKVLDSGKPIYNIRQEYFTTKGNYIDVNTSIFPLYEDNNIIGSAAIVRDYTEIQKLIERNAAIEQKFSDNNRKPGSKSKRKSNLNIYYNFEDIITKDKQLLETISWAKLTSINDSNVFIYGETGTGKELFAQSIHTSSNRKFNPFVAINCAAIPETLLESILFGTTKGSYTGAIDKMGLFEQADGGTIFLDEINSMPLMLQAKLLRVLEERKIMRIGDNKEISVDVRVISSCNTNPREAINNKAFRDDLFYRLAVVYLIIPPLRERKGDLEVLCRHFINKYNKKFNKHIKECSNEFMNIIQDYDWPGNVRQLKNIIESSMNLADENSLYLDINPSLHNIIKCNSNVVITPPDTYVSSNASIDENKDIMTQIKANEYSEIINTLQRTKGNISQAASLLGMSRQKLHYKIKKYNIH